MDGTLLAGAGLCRAESRARHPGRLRPRCRPRPPDRGRSCRPDMRAVVLTTEEEGIALAAGAWLGGRRAVLLMQSSGVGNCINMLSLPVNCRMPFLTLVTMRGEWGSSIPGRCRWAPPRPPCWPQPACTSAAPTALTTRRRLSRPRRRSRSTARCRSRCCSQRLIGAKDFANEATTVTLNRRAVVATLLREPGRVAGRHRPRRPHLRCRRRRRPGAELLPLGRDGRSSDDRARPGARPAVAAVYWCLPATARC